MAENNSPQRDFSKTLWPSLITFLGSLLIAAVGGYYTYTNARSEEKKANGNQATEMLANREQAETSFRQEMFTPLTAEILDDKQTLSKRIQKFELFENNFSDLYNCRSFFTVLNRAATKQYTTGNAEQKEEALQTIDDLTRIARNVSLNQKYLIGGCQRSEVLTNSKRFLKVELNDDVCPISDCDESVYLYLDSIGSDHIFIKMKIGYLLTDTSQNEQLLQVYNGKPFMVSYYDAPLTDNTLVPDGNRIGLVLDDLKKDSAIITLIHFPADYVTIGYRPTVSRINQLMDGGK